MNLITIRLLILIPAAAYPLYYSFHKNSSYKKKTNTDEPGNAGKSDEKKNKELKKNAQVIEEKLQIFDAMIDQLDKELSQLEKEVDKMDK